VTVLDAYALIAYFRDERAAAEVADLLGSASVLSVVNAAEVLDRLARLDGHDADDVHADLAILEHAGLSIVPVSEQVGLLAGRLRARHHHRIDCPVSLADCVAAATALSLGLPLATADQPLARVVEADGGRVHLLPPS
jgi:predicted nucleic acid-binding protein